MDMARWLGAGVVLQLVACAIVGLRLLALAARTRRAPELSLGCAFVLMGAVGYPLAIYARSGAAGEAAAVWLEWALAAQNVAALAIYVMNWRTFHPERPEVAAAVTLVALGFAASHLGAWWVGIERGADGGAFYYLGLALRAGAYVWAAFDSIGYYRLLRRRRALGLAEPVVLDRFRLWSIATVSISVGFAVFLTGRLVPGVTAVSPWVLVPTSLVAATSGVAMWLAFFPPRRYLARVHARAAAL